MGDGKVWSEENIKDYLKVNIKEERYNHVLGVVNTAETLAKLYGEDISKARYAAFIHDAAKGKKDQELIDIAQSKGYELCQEEKRSPQLLHGVVGAIIAKDLMEIYDKDILNAATYHTTGKVNMTNLEKIIYVADYIEPGRAFKGVDELRQLTFKDLDTGVLKAFDNTIKFVIDKGQVIHIRTIEARNYLLQEVCKGDMNE